jgi:hypothetical protein
LGEMRTMSRRFLLTAGLGAAAAGCVESPVIRNAAQVARNAVVGNPDLPLQRATITKLPYASMTARVGKGPQALLILGRIEGPEQHWLSTDRAAVVTRGGRVVRTFGFPENLRETRFSGEDPVDGRLHALDGPAPFTRYLDLEPERRYGVPIDSTFHTVGAEQIRIVELDFDVVQVRERNVARAIGWEFENVYWVDVGDGFVWRSRQHIARSFPPLQYDILKPSG